VNPASGQQPSVGDVKGLSIAGRVATPSDSDWDQARMGQILTADLQPQAVAFVEGPEDVSTVVGFARDQGLKVSALGTGHGAVPLGRLEDAILIKTERMKGIKVDPDAQTARVEAGARSAELGAAAGEHDLCFLPGSSPTVGVTGYTLGGGLGWLGRRHGFACNRVTAIELVTADGKARRVDADNQDDLFWALRGGGGGYAIVTALHLSLLPISEVYGGLLIFPAELGAEAIRSYRDWADGIADEVTSNIRFLRPPPLPAVPEPLRGRALLVIGAAFIGDEAEGEKLIAPLRALGEPIMDTFGQVPTSDLSRMAMDPEDPVPALGNHALVQELPDDAIDAFVRAAGADSGSPLLLADLRQLGGAFGRAAEGGGALDKLDAAFTLSAIGIPMSPEAGGAINSSLDRVVEAMRPWAAEGLYFNFVDRPFDVDAILPAETSSRLAEVKRKWDPDGVIRANHSVSLAPA
jgi:hypothetical protein